VSGASLNTGEQEDWRDVYIYRKKSFFLVCEDATEAKRNSNSCQTEQKKKKTPSASRTLSITSEMF